jgi:hypothetical protein
MLNLMQDATGNEYTRRQVTASFQGINEENTGKKNFTVPYVSGKSVRYLRQKKKIKIFRALCICGMSSRGSM